MFRPGTVKEAVDKTTKKEGVTLDYFCSKFLKLDKLEFYQIQFSLTSLSFLDESFLKWG